MKAVHPHVRALALGLLSGALPAQDPVLSTPGTATWETFETDAGLRTVFTIHDDTIFDWGEFHLASGSEMVFDFVGGDSVLNLLGGDGAHIIDGSVSGNGAIGFIAPGGDLYVGGSIIADEVTLSTLGVDGADFLDGNGFRLSSTGSGGRLDVSGRVEATAGDVILASERARIRAGAELAASGAIRMAGAEQVDVNPSGEQRFDGVVGDGFILHLGASRASRIEVAAGTEVANHGIIGREDARIFLEVGEGGEITNEGSGLILGETIFEGAIQNESRELTPDEGDASQVVSDARLRLPALKNPDGSEFSKTRTVSYRGATSASADSARDRREKPREVASRSSLVSRSSFFGMRGGKRGEASGR